MDQTKLIAYFKRMYQDDIPPDVDLPKSERPYYIPFSEELGVFFLFDEGDNFAVAQTKHIEALDWTDEKLLDVGIVNLDKIRKTIEVSKLNDIYQFSGSGNFEASLLLIPEFWEIGLSGHCPNGFVAALPSRDVLAVCDKNDKTAIDELIAIVNKVWPLNDHRLTKKLYERKDNKWEPYEPIKEKIGLFSKMKSVFKK
jgi:uncharacterized protein YtpQ (UPF0354 family)